MKKYPGWLHEVKLGATTVWERWNSLLDDGTISGISMNSMNHYSYGSVLEWMFRHAAGINPVDDEPGVRKVCFAPILNWKLRKMDASYDSPSGKYESSWNLEDPTHVTIRVKVPFGCKAELILPLAGTEIYKDSKNPMFTEVKDGVCCLTAGEYTVSYELSHSVKIVYSIDTPIRELLSNPETKVIIETFVPASVIPNQYMGHSIREMTKLFDSGITEKELEKLDKKLREI